MSFFSRFKRRIYRTVIFILILGVITSVVITVTNLAGDSIFKSKKVPHIICDTDLGLDPGDMYAISRLLLDKEYKIEGITTVHRLLERSARDHSALKSSEVANNLIHNTKMVDVPVLPGAERMFFPGESINYSIPAVDFIVSAAKSLDKKEKLTIFCLGPLTNIALALEKEPSIASKLILYFSGAIYDNKARIWNKNEFNVKNDLDAFDLILNNTEVELNIMPFNISRNLVFSVEEFQDLRSQNQDFSNLLDEVYHNMDLGEKLKAEELAVIEAYLNQEFGNLKNVVTPPENKQKSIKIYSSINYELMRADFLSVLRRKEF